jgi:hypothetical protein
MTFVHLQAGAVIVAVIIILLLTIWGDYYYD